MRNYSHLPQKLFVLYRLTQPINEFLYQVHVSITYRARVVKQNQNSEHSTSVPNRQTLVTPQDQQS